MHDQDISMIQEALARGDAIAKVAGLEHFRKAGELLLEAKAQVAPNEWRSWVKRNFGLSHTTANDYMLLAAEHYRVAAMTGTKKKEG